ncbi:MAG: PAS domain S-box protein, partial [Proteobacteria bacterium]|nr:PAS domain S-box protein [Pseudomonadota bacterium]
MVTASGKNSFKLPQFLAVIFILFFISISLTGYLYYRSQKTIIIADKHRELLTLAALKKSEIATWRQARIEDGEAISENMYFPYRIQEWLKNESLSGHRGEILSWMANRRSRPDYTAALLLDAQGTVRLSTAARSEPIDRQLQKSAVASLSARKPVLSDLVTSDSNGHIYINLLIPMLAPDAGDSPAVGVLVFRIDPHKTLYPLIQTSPIRSATGETQLVRREGDSVLFLNELRHRKNTALSLKIPLSSKDVAAVRAAMGQEGSFAGIDYRGMAVLAAVTAIPDSPWFLVAKIDEDEALGPFRKEVWFITILLLALISVAGVSIMLFWRQQQLGAERTQYALELERRNISQQYEYLKKYANDIILLFDKQGTILEANDRAIAAYGYSREELLQLPISQLRAYATRSSLEEDIRKISEQGGLVFETLHQRKDGTTFAVEISARVVAVEGKTLYQSILRDITDRKQAEQALRESQEQFRAVMEKANDAVFFVDTTGNIRFWNRTAEDLYGYREDEVLGQPFSTVVPKKFKEAHRQWLEKFLATDEETAPRATVEGIGERKDGSVFCVETSTGILQRGDDKFLIAIVRDVTERKKTEEEIKRKDSLLTGVAQSTGPLLSQDDLKSAVTTALAAIGRAAEVDRVYVFKNHDDPQTGEHLMSRLYEWAHESVTAQIDNPDLQNLPWSNFPGWYEDLSRGTPISGIVRDLPASIRAFLEPEDILSILLVPINIAGTFWGFIGFDDCKKERPWSDSEVSILLTLAGSIGSAMQRHQAEQELIETRDFLENIFS